MEKKGEIISKTENGHTLIVGQTRSGKGVNNVIPTEFSWGQSMIVFDPKGEGWGGGEDSKICTSRFRSTFSYTFRFEPENAKGSIHFNPLFSVSRGKDTIAELNNLSIIIIPINENSKDPFWEREARKLLTCLMGYTLYCLPPEKKNLRYVYNAFTGYTSAFDDEVFDELSSRTSDMPYKDSNGIVDENKKKAAINEKLGKLEETQKFLYLFSHRAKAYLKNNKAPEDVLKKYYELLDRDEEKFASFKKEALGYILPDDEDVLQQIINDLDYFADTEKKQFGSVKNTMMSNMIFLSSKDVQEVTSTSDFVFQDFLDGVKDEDGVYHPLSLYIAVSFSSMERLTPLIKIFFEQAIRNLTKHVKTSRYKLLLLIDEFPQLGKMPIIPKALSLTAGYGIELMLVIQSFTQLKTLYGSEEEFTDNCAYQIVLTANDPQNSKKVEEMLGKKTIVQKKVSMTGNYGTAHRSENISSQDVGRSLLTADEIAHIDENEAFMFESNQLPYKFKKIRYYLDDRFTPFYRENNGTGEVMTPPTLEEGNLPHPESPKGIDDQGWLSLVGVERFLLLSDPFLGYKENDITVPESDILLSPERQDEYAPEGKSMEYKDVTEENEKDRQERKGKEDFLNFINNAVEIESKENQTSEEYLLKRKKQKRA